jgi:hypothetical protein
MDAKMRICELAEQGLTDAEIAETLNQEGYRNKRGGMFKSKTVWQWRQKILTSETSDVSESKEVDSAQSDSSEPSDNTPSPSFSSDMSESSDNSQTLFIQSEQSDSSDDTEPPSGLSETSDNRPAPISEPFDISENMPLPEHWRLQIVQIVQTTVRDIMADQNIQKHQTPDQEIPPVPEKTEGAGGRKVALGARVKIAGTIDTRLEKLLRDWQQQRGISLSKALDAVLWNFFGKPALSFETAEPDDS